MKKVTKNKAAKIKVLSSPQDAKGNTKQPARATPKSKSPSKASKAKAKAKAKASGGASSSTSLKYGIEMTKKHLLVHSILKRWNYCLPPWPPVTEDRSNGLENRPGFIETGFKGIYAGYRGDVCGEIIDTRVHTRLMPTLNNLLTIDSEELKQLLLDGIVKQKQDLIKHKHLNSTKDFVVHSFNSLLCLFCLFVTTLDDFLCRVYATLWIKRRRKLTN